MIYQLVNISLPEVFKRYSDKYNIFKDLLSNDLRALEIRYIEKKLADDLMKIYLEKKEICYKIVNNDNTVNLLALGNFSILHEISKEIIPLGYEDLGFKINRLFHNYSDYSTKSITIAGREFDLTKSYSVGILNVTPDSFSDGGKFSTVDKAYRRALFMLRSGIDILDIGGESTRPGANPVDEDLEIERVIPIIRKILSKRPETLISVDTTKAKVAELALESGAKIVNDISAMTFDKKMMGVVSKFKATIMIMHIKGTPKTMQDSPKYSDVVSEVYDFLAERVAELEKNQINNIIIDPGIGFGKRIEDNYELLRRLDEFKGIGKSIMVGVSRKSLIGDLLKVNIRNRDSATSSLELYSIMNGARFFRTHNAKIAAHTKKMAQALLNPYEISNV
ncbi:MAG: dihydropteroate synthase [Melioribacteraceae bacterium]|nr:dihydropteroate synthase [Melioribacteraceae bacterium]MCF8265075.1 dihydropteroate synthase [Melioribacteraceae bacterium]